MLNAMAVLVAYATLLLCLWYAARVVFTVGAVVVHLISRHLAWRRAARAGELERVRRSIGTISW